MITNNEMLQSSLGHVRAKHDQLANESHRRLHPHYSAGEFLGSPRLSEAISFLREAFSGYSQIWLIGHKGDHALNLMDLGVLPRTIHLAHVHSSLGIDAQTLLTPPAGSSDSYRDMLLSIDSQIESYIAAYKERSDKVVVLMPFPNQGLEVFIRAHGVSDRFLLTAPVSCFEDFLRIEDKIVFARMMKSLFGNSSYRANLIPFIQMRAGDSYDGIFSRLGLSPGSPVYFQRSLSAGGDGTVRVSTPEEFHALLSDSAWSLALVNGKIKVSPEILDAYPANGTGCIVPVSSEDCIVLVDPPSHKPVGLPSLHAKPNSGVGNDWSVPFPEPIRNQYLAMVTEIGRYLYRQYGYTGLFGPDGLVSDCFGGDPRYFITEVNARFQGTTPYQTLNALLNDRIPLEIIHYMVKLAGNDHDKLEHIREIIGDPDTYNLFSLQESGGFYLKIGGPKDPTTIRHNFNGPWLWDGDQLSPVNESLSLPEVYTRRRFNGQRIDIPPNTHLVWIKAPLPGEVVTGGLAPIGYVTGSGIQVFESDKPDITSAGLKLYTSVRGVMF